MSSAEQLQRTSSSSRNRAKTLLPSGTICPVARDHFSNVVCTASGLGMRVLLTPSIRMWGYESMPMERTFRYEDVSAPFAALSRLELQTDVSQVSYKRGMRNLCSHIAHAVDELQSGG